jgi:hypothetical protein
MRTISIIIIIILLLISSTLIPSKEKHLTRNRYNKLPVGNLRRNGEQFIDSDRTAWIQRPYIMSLMHSPNQNYVFETDGVSSSEAIADKTLFNNSKQIFTHGTYNYNSPLHNPFLHLLSDVLPSLFYYSQL